MSIPKIPKGKVSTKLMEQADKNEAISYQELEGGTVRAICPTEDPAIKELRGGSACGTQKVGTLEVNLEGLSYFSGIRFDEGVSLFPLALSGWGEFIAQYVIAITEPKEKSNDQ